MNPIRFAGYILPLIEIALFIVVGSWIGVLGTLFLVALTTFIGLLVLRMQRISLMQCMQNGFCGPSGKPLFNFMDNSLAMFGGMLLILPGFFTDFMGVLCLVPSLRGYLARLLTKFKTRQPSVNDAHIIEGKCWHEGEVPSGEGK